MKLFDDLRGQGTLDSSGRFTLSSEKALEKLRAYQQTSPRAYLLNLVSSAVEAGATRLQVSTLGQQVIFEHDGAPPQPEDFEDVPNHLTELTIGLLGTPHATVEFGGSWITVKQGTFRRTEAGPRSGVRITVHRPRQTFGDLTPEVLDLETHCGLVRCELWADGEHLNRKPNLRGCQPVETDGAYEAVLGTGVGPGVELVVRGVSFRTLVPGAITLQGAVWADGLRKDLSQTSLVRDDELLALERWLTRAYRP